MKITMYELLGMVKDSKAPKKFIYDNQLFILDEEDNVYRSHLGNRFGAMYQLDIKLNDEIEILEGTLEEENKIPEKLEDISEIKCVGCKVEINIAGNKTLFDTDTPIVTEHCIYKINQLIKNQKKIVDYLKSKGK